MKREFDIAGNQYTVTVTEQAVGHKIVIDGVTHTVLMRSQGVDRHVLTLNGKQIPVHIAREQNTVFIHAFGRSWQVDEFDSRSEVGGLEGSTGDTITAPMPGIVISCSLNAGDRVSEGDELLVVESMKLQVTLRAPRDGVIASYYIDEGATFEKSAMLVALEPRQE